MRRGSMPRALPCWMWLSIMAAEQVVGRGDGVEIAGEMEVDVLHGDNLGIAAAGSTALDAEYRAERGLTQGDDSLLADAGHRLAQTYGGGSFALTGGSGVDGGNQDQFAVFRRSARRL